jgi:hypothetical protein
VEKRGNMEQSILVNAGKERTASLIKLAERRGTTPERLIAKAIDALLVQAANELNAPVVDKKTGRLLRQTAAAKKVTPEVLIKDFQKLSEETLLRKYGVGPRATAELLS